jgi:hypothetical protein
VMGYPNALSISCSIVKNSTNARPQVAACSNDIERSFFLFLPVMQSCVVLSLQPRD